MLSFYRSTFLTRYVNFLERFSMECCKTKPKSSQQPVRRKEKTLSCQWELKVKTANQRATRSWLVLVLHLIGWKSGARFLDQSQSEIKQNQINHSLNSILNRKLLELCLVQPQFQLLRDTFIEYTDLPNRVKSGYEIKDSLYDLWNGEWDFESQVNDWFIRHFISSRSIWFLLTNIPLLRQLLHLIQTCSIVQWHTLYSTVTLTCIGWEKVNL